MAIDAQVGDIQGFVIIPMVTFEPESSATPGTAFRPRDEAELLSERRGVSRRSGANPTRSEQVQADFQVSAKAGELGVLAVPSAFFHDELPVMKT